MRFAVAAAALTALLLPSSAVAGRVHVVDGTFGPGDPTSLQFHTEWQYWVGGGLITFDDAQVDAAEIIVRSQSGSGGKDPEFMYPIEMGCGALLGGACTFPFGLPSLSVPNLHEVHFAGTPKELIYRYYRVTNPTYPGVQLSYSFGDETTDVNFHLVPDTPGGTVHYHLTYGFDVIPEPSMWAVMLTGFGTAGGALRRRKHSQARA